MRRRSIVTACLLTLALAPAAGARAPVPEDRGGSARCNAVTVTRGAGDAAQIVVRDAIGVVSRPRSYRSNTALWTSVRGVGCRSFYRLMADVLPAPDELVALELAGWRVTTVDRFPIDGVPVHQVWAVKGRRRILYVRRGEHPRVSLDVYRAAQNVAFDRSTDEYGRGSGCTAAYVLRLGNGALAGLTAGHCSRYPFFDPSGVWQTEDAVRFRRKLPGFELAKQPLGSVIANPELEQGGPDALVFGLGGVPLAAQQLERGYSGRLTPYRVVGTLPTREQRNGRVICYSGRRSGSDNCGRIYERLRSGERMVICAHVKTQAGDSGGPVYTPARAGEVRAAGIVTASRAIVERGDLCYTPLQPILAAFDATLPTGAFRTAFDNGLGGPSASVAR